MQSIDQDAKIRELVSHPPSVQEVLIQNGHKFQSWTDKKIDLSFIFAQKLWPTGS
jgi:hypothetical protein